MGKKIEVSKIIVKIGDKETELTVEQARELKDVLANLLGNDKEKDVIYIPQPYPVPTHPYRYWITYPDWTYRPPVYTSGDEIGNKTVSVSSANYTLELKS